jgi:hypothetical protein
MTISYSVSRISISIGLGSLIQFLFLAKPFISLSDLLVFAAFSATIVGIIRFRFLVLFIPSPFTILVSLGISFGLLRLIRLASFCYGSTFYSLLCFLFPYLCICPSLFVCLV